MKEVSEKYMKKIYLNVLKAIIIVLYFFVLNVACENVNPQYLEKGIELCTMILLFISIFIFEWAYRKDDDDLAIQGIEILILSAYTLTSQHITKKFDFPLKNYLLVASYIFAIYFILKCIVVYTKGRKEMAENLSDIKEIVQKDEPVKKEATKKKKEDVKEEELEEIKEEKTQEIKETPKKKTTTKTATKKKATTATPTKKTTTARKTTSKSKSTSKNESTSESKANELEKKPTTRKTTGTKKKTETKKETEKKEGKTETKKKTTRKPKQKSIDEKISEEEK
ncbi:unknown [Clostridium sp. CAG:389]|nr:unknown [Clostridium sp. CAG:389]